MAQLYDNFNALPMHDGKTMHMGLSMGQLAPRIVCVGSEERLQRIALLFDQDLPTYRTTSGRGFRTATGHFKGVSVSVVSIGMGPSMVDFFVRETCAITPGPLAIIRFGTCGGISEEVLAGKVVVASKGSGCMYRNLDAFVNLYGEGAEPVAETVPYYKFAKIVPANAALSALVKTALTDALGVDSVVEGTNVTADSFYSTQGRDDPNFEDHNENNIALVKQAYPNATNFEMETFYLFHLAHCSRKTIFASAAAIVVANRLTGEVVNEERLDELETEGGRAVLTALTLLDLTQCHSVQPHTTTAPATVITETK